MVVTCPNCGARYAVDPRKIGSAGRTVQCARCDHRWFQTIEGPGESSPPAPPPAVASSPAQAAASPPAVVPPEPAYRWRRLLAVAVVLLVLVAAALFAFRERMAGLVEDARTWFLTQIASNPPASADHARPRIEVDLDSSKIDVVDGRYVVRGQLVNNGKTAGSTTLLRLTYKRNDEVVGERSVPMVEGPLPPGGRVNFSQVLDDPPEGTTDIVPVAE